MFNSQEGFHTYYVYIITNAYRSTFYIGMTNNLKLRLSQHKENIVLGNKTFASKYNLEFLVYYQKFTWVQEAIAREKELKKWRREKKLDTVLKKCVKLKICNFKLLTINLQTNELYTRTNL